MQLSKIGEIIEDCLNDISDHFSSAEVWNYVIMPNHVHIVLFVDSHGSAANSTVANAGCLKPPKHGEGCPDLHHNSLLSQVVGLFKAAVTRKYHSCKNVIAVDNIWQRLYHDHIIRNQYTYDKIMNYYIDNNVTNWDSDCFNIR